MLSLDLVRAAAETLRGRVQKTPVEYSSVLSKVLAVPVWLKLEQLQITGSFKYRGALFAMSQLKAEGVEHISTCSAGNHGWAVARAAHELGMSATIYVPSGVDQTKYRAMVDLEADVVVSESVGYDDTERWALEETERRQLPFLSAYDDERIMAGNGGTVALEVLEQVPGAKTFVMPAGGGGHSAGFAFTVSRLQESYQFVLCQHVQAPAFKLSMEKGYAVTELPGIETLASGIEGGFGVKTFEILRHLKPHVALVSEDEIREAMIWMYDHHQHIIEGSSAVAVAACLKNDLSVASNNAEATNTREATDSRSLDGPVVVFISGRNVSLDTLRDVFCD
ncbi:MAG: hydroxyectoine utilization dehydratase EutB [Rhodothermia bacterium]|nr:MAG: hydroxyectoine utilization dehydratase EutB [Rhodothermia bacterium]